MKTEITCPGCRATIDKLVLASIPVEHEKHKAILLCCPSCGVALQAQLDPLAVATEVRNSLLQELKDHLAKLA